jgi:histidine triad (HIT) family protein
MGDCIFCRIARGEARADVILDTTDAVAVRDINPQAPVHALVIPKRHVESLNDATGDGLLGDLLQVARSVARKERVAESGYRVVANTGNDGGQTVPHLHLHVLGGRRMTWPPG